jgi:ABC-type transport system substrate-binding protein
MGERKVMNKSGLIVIVAMALMLIPLFTPMVHGGGPPQPPIITKTFWEGTIGWGPVDADPAIAYDTASGELLFNSMQGLLAFKGETYTDFVPTLATNEPTRLDITMTVTNTSAVGADPTGTTWTDGTNSYTITGWVDEGGNGFNAGDVIFVRKGVTSEERTWTVDSKTGTSTMTLGLWRGSYTFTIRDGAFVNTTDINFNNPVGSQFQEEATGDVYTVTGWEHSIGTLSIGDNLTVTGPGLWRQWAVNDIEVTPDDPIPGITEVEITICIYFYGYDGNIVGTFTYEDVVYSFQRALVLDVPGQPVWMLDKPLFGRPDHTYWSNSTAMDLARLIDNAIVGDAGSDIGGSEIPPTVTINVGCRFPDNAFKQILSNTWGCIEDKGFYVGDGNWDGNLYTTGKYPGPQPNWWIDWAGEGAGMNYADDDPADQMDPTMMAGTGPFHVAIIDDVSLVVQLRKNPDFWQGWPARLPTGMRANDSLDTVEIDYIATWATRKAMFIAGEIDTCAVPRAVMFQLLDANKNPLYPIMETISNIRPTLTLSSFLFTFTTTSIDYRGTGSFPGGIPTDFFNNSYVRRAFASAIGRGYPKYTERDTVSVGDTRLTAVNVTSARYANSSLAVSEDADRGWTLLPFSGVNPRFEEYVDENSNHVYDSGEVVYRDMDNNGVVSVNDERLTNVTLMTGSEEVGIGDGSKTVFNLKHTHVMPQSETIWLGGNPTTDYTIDYEAGVLTFNSPPGNGETVTAWNYTYYFAGNYPEGTTVGLGDADLGLAITNFASDEMFYDQNGNGAYDRTEFIYKDVGRNIVSDGDIRNDEVYPNYAAGSTVNQNDDDVGRTLINGQNHYNALIEDIFYNEAAEPPTPLLESLYPDYRDAKVLAYNYSLADAAADLTAAMFGAQSVWQTGFTLTILFNTGNDEGSIVCQMIADFFNRLSTYAHRVGPPFTVNIQTIDMNRLISDFVAGEIPACVMDYSADYSDADSFMRVFMHSAGHFASRQNYTAANGWGTAKDTLIDQALATVDGPTRASIYQQLQVIYSNDCPSFPLYQPYGRRWCQYWVKGWYYNAIYPSSYFATMWKQDDCWGDVSGATAGVSDGANNMFDIAWLIAHFNHKAPVPGYPIDPKWVGVYGANGAVDTYGDRVSNMKDIAFNIRHFNHKMNTNTP